MNILLVTPSDRNADGHYLIKGKNLEHLVKVLKVEVSQTVFMGEVNGLMGYSKVLDIQEEFIVMEGDFEMSPPQTLPITLILAMARPTMLKKMLRDISMLGVKEIYLINTKKVEKSFWQSKILEKESLEKYLLQGLSQSKDTVLPKLHLRNRFNHFVEDELPNIIKGSKAIVAHPGKYPAFPQGIKNNMTLAIGPEGGFTNEEVQKLASIGFEVVHCGERILRMETAVVSLISQHSNFIA